MKDAEAYRAIAKHVFVATRKYEGNKQIIVMANDIDEATVVATDYFGVSVAVRRISPTKTSNVFEI